MKKNTYKVIPIFSQPLLESNLPQDLSNIVPFLENQKIKKQNNLESSKRYGFISENTYILNSPKCKFLSNYILSLAKAFGDQILNYNHSHYKFTQSWISIKPPGSHHVAHHHPNSLISGVFYYGEFLEDTPSLCFDPQPPLNSPAPHFKNNVNPLLESFCVKPKFGSIYMFPSYYTHHVPENRTNLPRKSVAFNIIPIDGFGSEDQLTRIKF